MFDVDTVFYLIDNINLLMGKLSNVSRQTVIVIANFLSMMHKINDFSNKNDESVVKIKEVVKKEKINVNFTKNEFTEDEELTENKKNVVDNQFDDKHDKVVVYNDNNKEIIINNTFAVASKNVKIDLLKKYSLISEYLTDKKFTTVASTLIDTVIEVAGEKYIILSAKNDMIVDKVYNEYKL